MTVIAFTGVRPTKMGGYILPNPTYKYVCQELEKLLLQLKPDKCISGAALGFDQSAANVCFKLGIPVLFAVPFIGQEKAWPQKSQEIYHKLLSKAAEVVIVSEGDYSADKMQIRNVWMIDRGEPIISCSDGTSGGTANAIAYARSLNRTIINIDPRKAPK